MAEKEVPNGIYTTRNGSIPCIVADGNVYWLTGIKSGRPTAFAKSRVEHTSDSLDPVPFNQLGFLQDLEELITQVVRESGEASDE